MFLTLTSWFVIALSVAQSVDISIDYNNTCPARNGSNLSNYTCYGFQCGIASCLSDASKADRQNIDVGVDVAEWCNYNWYNACDTLLNTTYQPLSEAAYHSRIRYKVSSLTDSQKETLRIALTCSNLIADGGAKDNYEYNSVRYLTTFHGLPEWFDDCQSGRQGNAPGTCCVHHSPQFWTWHRLYITQFENSLRQWIDPSDDVGVPYFGWVDYIESENGGNLPSLISDLTFDVNGATFRNPFYIYQTSQESLDYWLDMSNFPNEPKHFENDNYCQYTKTTATDGLYNMMTPGTTYSLFKQIYNSMFYKSLIGQDLPGEIPHDNVHDFLFGNMANLDISSLTPIFLTHHAAVEKYWLIWQLSMKNTFDIDYTEKKWQNHYFGCFRQGLLMEAYLAPFEWSSTQTNSDPVTKSYATNGFAPFDWEGQYYTYDEFNIGTKDNSTLQKELCHYFKDTTSKGCKQYADTLFDGSFVSDYNASMWIGWYLEFEHYGMSIDYSLYLYEEKDNENASISSGTFRIQSGGYDAWTEAGTRFLYKLDVTDDLMARNLSFKDDYFYVTYTITVKSGNNGSDSDYETYDNNDDYLDYPIFIYKDGYHHDSPETYQIYFGDNHYRSNLNKTFMLHPAVSLDERNHNLTIEVVSVSTLADATTFELSIGNDLYNVSQDIDFGEIIADVAINGFYVGHTAIGFTYLVDNNTNNSLYFSYTSENVIYAGDVALVRHFADHMSYQGFDGRMFTLNESGTSMDDLKNQFEDILEAGQINVPWSVNFTHNSSSLYNTVHSLTGWTVQDSINLIACASSNCDETSAYVVYTKDDYDNCNVDANATRNKHASTTFSCSSGWKFENETTYYFLSANVDDCNKGLKFGIYFGGSTNCRNNIGTSSCTMTSDIYAKGSVAASNVLNGSYGYDLNFTIEPQDDSCDVIDYTLQIPYSSFQENGWYGFGFYGPWTGSSEDTPTMYGYAIVIYLCEKCSDDSSDTLFTETWSLNGPGEHTLIADLAAINACNHHNVYPRIEITCSIENSNLNAFTWLKDTVDFKNNLGSNHDYHFVYAEYTTDCNNGFTSLIPHSNKPPLLTYHYYSKTGDSGNSDDNNTMSTTKDDSGDDAHRCLSHVFVVIVNAIILLLLF